jgi:hypothetical protein
MDILNDLSIKIAEVTVPDEIDLAPLMTDAFIQGGKKREALFSKQGSTQLGAFELFEGVLVFPWILKGIAIASPFILKILQIDGNSLSVINNFLEICEKLGIKENNRKENNRKENNRKENNRKENKSKLSEEYSVPLDKIFETFSSELETSGIPEERCEEITSKVVITLLKDPSVSVVFVEKVAGSK